MKVDTDPPAQQTVVVAVAVVVLPIQSTIQMSIQVVVGTTTINIPTTTRTLDQF